MLEDLGAWVRTAEADALEAQGLLREPRGGGALRLRDLVLLASGLPGAQTNRGDVTGPAPDVDGARAFFAARGVPWGLRVPPELPWSAGRPLFRQRLMGLPRAAFRPAPPVDGLVVRPAGAADFHVVAGLDAAAFGGDPATDGPWFEPLLGAAAAEVALAELDGAPAATAYTLRSDGPAGPSLYLAGVAVLAAARRRGAGAAVSSWLLERGFARGAALAHLHPDTDEAARLYARLGFTEVPGLDVYVDL